ncbi:hypothetical protein FLL45_15830 [Aliikangiella marina]|uniref:Uncharacterized protein n=1 Tax=Aliikangiella marina TaxID=1712262 RepID=A0A545T6T2_9GAMM|nr:ankyrin repeat domain-containing protein [Aliikangiella marina]TQV72934.1 hypothetical protein FLL45_15830 [Aliikangiella marina]
MGMIKAFDVMKSINTNQSLDRVKLCRRLAVLLGCLVGAPILAEPKDLLALTTEQRLEKIRIVESQNNKSFFCECSFDMSDQIDADTCNAKLTNTEVSWHNLIVVPDSKLQKQLENDLHTLYPLAAISDFDWSNIKAFGEVKAQSRSSRCGLKIDKVAGIVQPPESRMGDIARLYFYLQDEYGLRLSANQSELYQKWDRSDPPDANEIARNNWLSILQGRRINLPGSDYVAAINNYRLTDFSQQVLQAVARDFNRVHELLVSDEFDPGILTNRLSNQIEYNREYWFKKWIKENDAEPLLELYSIYRDLVKHSRFYFDEFSSEKILKVLSLAILRGDNEFATFLARQIILFYDVNEDYYDKSLTMDLLFRMSQLFLNHSNETSKVVDSKYPMFDRLFDDKSSVQQFTRALAALSNQSIPAFGYGIDSTHLFQIQVLAINHLRKLKVGNAASRFPYLIEFTQLKEFATQEYTPTKRHKDILAKINLLPELSQLYLAVVSNDETKVKQLMQAGATVNQLDRYDRTPLNIAVVNKNLPIVKLLAQNKSDLKNKDWNKYHTNALHFALKNNLVAFADHLLTQGVPVDYINTPKDSRYALKAFFAQHQDSYNTQLFERLLQSAPKSSKSKWSSPLDEAISKPRSIANAMRLFELLIQYGFDPKDSYALNYDQVIIYPKLVKFLLDKQVNVNSVWVLDQSPLHVAIENDAYESAKLLLEAGADLTHKNYDKQTPLEHAKYRENEKMVALISTYL